MPRRDPEKNREYQRKWYKKNRELQIVRNKENKEVKKEWLREYKLTQSCRICGESHPATLDFHHLDPSTKDRQVTQLVTDNCSMERIEAEIAKCEILCANCHRKVHWDGR